MEKEQIQAELLEGERATRLVNSEEWKWAKDKLESHMVAVDSINTLPEGSNEQVGEEAKVRKRAQGLVLSWLQEIEGLNEGYLAYKQSMVQESAPLVYEVQ